MITKPLYILPTIHFLIIGLNTLRWIATSLREKIESHITPHVAFRNQLANVFTKALSRDRLIELVMCKLGMINIYAPTVVFSRDILVYF